MLGKEENGKAKLHADDFWGEGTSSWIGSEDIYFIGLFLGLSRIGNRWLILEEETHPCSEIVINIRRCVPSPALLFHKICYTAAKIAHLQASFLQGRKRDMSHVFHVHFGRMVFIMACSLLLITVEYPACTLCTLACF